MSMCEIKCVGPEALPSADSPVGRAEICRGLSVIAGSSGNSYISFLLVITSLRFTSGE